MMAARFTFKTLTFLVAIALAVSLAPCEVISGQADFAEADACCTQENDLSAPPCNDTESAPLDEGCCPDSCSNCFLSCCAGPVSLAPSAVILGPIETAGCTVAMTGTNFNSGYPGEIYHPPYL